MLADLFRDETLSVGDPPGRKGWRRIYFGDVVRNVDSSVRDPITAGIERFVGLDDLDPESLRIRRWGQVADGTTFTRRFIPGQVLFGKRRAYQRKVALADFEGICSGDILVFEPANDDLLSELLPFIAQSEGFFQHALGTSAGSLSPRTRWSDLAKYEFLLPPKDEQRRIAEILWEIENAANCFDSARNWVTIADRALRDRAFALRGRLGNWQLPIEARSRQGETVELGHVSEVTYGLTLGPGRQGLGTTRPYLRVANVKRENLDLDEIKEIGCTADEANRLRLQVGDILVVEGHANPDEVGRSAGWNGELDDCLYQNHILRVRCAEVLRPDYALAYLER